MSHVWFVVRLLHLLAMAFFVGWQMMLAAVIVPVGRRSTDRENLRLIARRFGYGTLVALGVPIATGTAMAFHLHACTGFVSGRLGGIPLVASGIPRG